MIAEDVIEVGVTVFPLKLIALDWLNPEPLIVRLKSPEFVTIDEGDKLVIAGTGLLI